MLRICARGLHSTNLIVESSVWEHSLKERFMQEFNQRSFTDPTGSVKRLTTAQFFSTLYDLGVLKRDQWPAQKILEEMHSRSYGNQVFIKESYGAQPPPGLQLDDCIKWLAYFKVVSLNQI